MLATDTFYIKQCLDGLHMREVTSNYQWDVPVDAAEFAPVIPEDYQSPVPGSIRMPGLDEASAVKGLQFQADLFGEYSDQLDFQAVMSKYRNLDPGSDKMQEFMKQQFGDQENKPTQDQMTAAVIRISMTLKGPCLFYAGLVQEKKDPAYYGKRVTPEDADKLLLRWKLSDSEYRVIYGDLRAETVSAERLAELEKALPQ